ncbi:MAG TPA: DinB family protein [Acidimicrobiales bacterium]
MAVEPDTKDWTWVLERPCPECGFDTSTLKLGQVSHIVRGNAARWRLALADERVARRPSADVWSALEYGCHVRDVFRLYDERLARMLAEDDPLYANWDQDKTAVDDRYDLQSPARVAHEIDGAADVLAGRFETVSSADWHRTGRRSDGVSFTVETFARYFVHDPIHHLHDVEIGYELLGRG